MDYNGEMAPGAISLLNTMLGTQQVNKVFMGLALLCTSLQSSAQAWDLTLSQPEDVVMYGAIEDSAGNFILCGWIGDYSTQQYDGYLAKLSAAGDTLATNRIAGAVGNLQLSSLIQTGSNYMAVGTEDIGGVLGNQGLVMGIDANLNVLWKKTYGTTQHTSIEAFQKIRPTQGGTYLAVAYTNDDVVPANSLDYAVYELSASGDSLRSKYYSFLGQQWVFDIIEHGSGYKLFTMGTPDTNSWLGDEIVNLDSNMNIDTVISTAVMYPNPLGSAFHNTLTAKWISDSVYAMCAHLYNFEYVGQQTVNTRDIGLLFLNQDDSVVGAFAYGKSDTIDFTAPKSMDFVDTSAIYLGGTSEFKLALFSGWDTWYYIVKINSAGTVLWEKWYGGDADYLMYNVLATQDGGCLLTGTRYDTATTAGVQQRDIYVLKLGPDGILSTEDNPDMLDANNYVLYPNPTSGSFTIKGNYTTPALLQLFDISGKQALTQPLPGNFEQIGLRNLPAGVYVYILTDADGRTGRGKLVVE